MRILFSADCLYPALLGGPSQTTYWLATAISRNGHDVATIAIDHCLPENVPRNQWLTRDCGRVLYTTNPHFYFPIHHIWQAWRSIQQVDFVHVNSLFYPASLVWVLMARFWRKPVVWSPHGEANPVALQFHPLRKRLMIGLLRWLNPDVQFHVTSSEEASHIRQIFGNDAPVHELRLLVELPARVVSDPQAKPYLLFIGRLHPIKAVDRLFSALAESITFRESDYELLIAGPMVDEAYFQLLRSIVEQTGLTEKVRFIGNVVGTEKDRLYANARLTILPSHAENFGAVVVESLAQGTPVIASVHTPWKWLADNAIGDWIANDPASIRHAVEKFVTMPPETYAACRERATRLVRQRFDLQTNIGEWEQLYAQVLATYEPSARMNTAITFHEAQVDSFSAQYQRSLLFRERFSVWKTLLDTYVEPQCAVMDLGCGPGIFSRYTAEKGCRVTGVDGSEAMIAHCRSQARFSHERYSRQLLPLQNPADFPLQDVVLLSSVLEYVPDYEKLFWQVHDLLRPGGVLLVSVPNRSSIYRRLETLIFRLTKRPRYRAFSSNAFTEQTFARHMESLNFSLLETNFYGGQRLLTPLLRLLLPRKYADTLFVGVYRKNPSPHPPTHENYQHRRYAAQHSESGRSTAGFSEVSAY